MPEDMPDLKSENFFELPVSLRIRGSRETVFNAWILPETARHWLCDRMEGDWKPGASVYWHHGDHRQSLQIISVEKNNHLSFRWKAWGIQSETDVKIEFTELGEETRLRILESKWPLSRNDVAIALDHACGWENTLCRLKAWIETGARFSSATGSYSAKEGRVPPVLETDNLRMRFISEKDISEIVRYSNDNKKHFAATEPPRPPEFFTEDFWRTRLSMVADEFNADRSLKFYLFDRKTDSEILGSVEFSQIARGPFQACYLGYGIAEKHEGKGLMFEAVRAVIDFAFSKLNIHRIMANHLPDNHKSAKLLKRLGFATDGLAKDYLFINGAWRDHVLNSLTNHAWKKPNETPK